MFVETEATEGAAAAAGVMEPMPSRPAAEVPLEEVEAEIRSLASRIAAGTCRYLELVADFDRRDGWWRDPGIRSMADWLAWKCALTPRAAREHVRVARALGEVPAIHGEFKAGRLTYSKVRALTRIATRESEEDLLELARHATAAQLERMIRAARRVSPEDASASHERACLWFWQEDGSLCLKAQLPAEEGAALVEAIEAARTELARRRWAEGPQEADEGSETALRGSAEPRPRRYPRPANHECLAYLAEQALARGPSRSSPADAYQVIVHVDATRLAGDGSGEGPCHLAGGPAISAATARRIACEAPRLTVVDGPGGEPLSVGRRTRAVPPALRRALELRDGGCRFPGCEQRRHTDAHHIVHWADGGETKLSNLILLCRRHHRLCHERGYEIELDERRRPCFRPPGGRPVPAAPPLGPVSEEALESFAPAPSGVLTGTGERIDLSYCVDAVLAAGQEVRSATASSAASKSVPGTPPMHGDVVPASR